MVSVALPGKLQLQTQPVVAHAAAKHRVQSAELGCRRDRGGAALLRGDSLQEQVQTTIPDVHEKLDGPRSVPDLSHTAEGSLIGSVVCGLSGTNNIDVRATRERA